MPQPRGEKPIAVMLVEDHLLVRRGFRRMLEDEPGIRVVAEAGDGQEAIDTAIKERPDVIVMDFALPSMNGAVATRRILDRLPATGVLILSMHSEPAYVRNGSRPAASSAARQKSSVSFPRVDAYQRAIRPSIPSPFQGFGCVADMT